MVKQAKRKNVIQKEFAKFEATFACQQKIIRGKHVDQFLNKRDDFVMLLIGDEPDVVLIKWYQKSTFKKTWKSHSKLKPIFSRFLLFLFISHQLPSFSVTFHQICHTRYKT